MAVANPCLKKEWAEWKKEMEENRRRRWRERVSRWSIVEESEEMEEEEDDGEETESEEGEISRDEEENDPKENGENEDEGDAEEGENEVWKGIGEEDRGATEVEERVDVEEEENKIEGKIKENNEVDEDEETELKKADGLEEEGGDVEKEVEREVLENKEEDEEEDIMEATDKQIEQQEGENEIEREVKQNEEVVAEEEEEVTEAEEVEDKEKEVEKEAEKEVKREVKGNGEVDEVEEKEAMEAEEIEEGQEQGENGFDRDIWVNEEVDEEEDRKVREEEQVEKDDDKEEDHQEQEQIGQYCFAERFREQMRTEEENVLQNQGSTRQEVKTVNEEESLPDTVESSEDSDLTESEDECYNFKTIKDEERDVEDQNKDLEELKDPDENSWGNENSFLGVWTSKERKEAEDENNKLTDEKETVAESWTTQEEEFQDDHEKLHDEDEESTDDEEEKEHSDDEDEDDNDVIKMYYKDDYLTDLFGTLTEFRDSFLLTDLTLSTEEGKSFHVHSLVLAAVSSLIQESLSRSNIENIRVDEMKDEGLHRWSVSLGPDVDHVGLKAVVEFAYTGHILCLNKDTVHQIKAAAQTLGAPRVLDLCTEEEEKSTITGEQKKEKRISAAEHMTISLQSIKQLWMERVGCDVTLEAVGGLLHVHRVILAAQSDYFRSMFTLGMRESYQPCVTLPYLLASELEVLIDCSYSGALPLSWRCVFEITSTALQLQYQPALSLCLNFLQQEINPHSCLDVASFAEAYEMLQLLEVADDFVLRQFQKVASTSKFKDLPAKKLLRYLKSHSLCVPSELVVFKAVVAWIQAKPKTRLKLAKELMKTIHFPLMTFKEFKEVQSLNMWSDHSLAELYEAVFEDFCSNETAPQHECRIYLPKESLVLIGGDQTSEDLGSRSISRELWFGNSLRNHTGIKKAMEWRRLAEIPDSGRFSHEVTALQGQLYVFGGKKYYGTNDTLNSVYRYDPLQNSWESLAEMQEKRCSFSVVVLDGKIYAIGGHCDPEHLESVEQYCPISNSWSFTWPLDLPLSTHVAKVLHGQIFVSGGLSSDFQCLASMFLYHPETGSTYLANMAKPRAHHCMETLGEYLYVAGGITTDDNVTFVDQLACEVYNPVADCWTAFTSLPVPHVGAGSTVLEGKFYVLGGYSHEDYSDTKMVHRFDPTIQRWENMGKMPGPNNDIRAALLCLPTHFRL